MNTTKLSYIAVATSIILTACTHEDVPDTDSSRAVNRILFRTSLPQVTSRAQTVSMEDIDEFHVTAFNPGDPELKDPDGKLNEFIKDVLVKKDTNRGLFNSENCLWPEQGQEENVLSFFAYYPALTDSAFLTNTSTISGNVANIRYAINKFRISTDISEQLDFIVAHTKGSMIDNMFSGIRLEFRHKLSRIEVMAKSSNKSCKLEIAGVRIGGIHMQGTYNFKEEADAGDWTLSDEKDQVGYIFGPEDNIVALDNTATPVSIMGGNNGVNYAMLLPSKYQAWNYSDDHTNSRQGMYISVLLRVLDKTPGGNDKQQYPYFDYSQGLNAMNIPRVYLVVDKATGKIINRQVYKKELSPKYYYDENCTIPFTLPANMQIKEFGWAALPVTGEWEPGYAYTYTLDYTSGVGLHDPNVKDPQSESGSDFPGPKAGDPIISDRVGVTVSVNGWQGGDKTTHDFEVPGS